MLFRLFKLLLVFVPFFCTLHLFASDTLLVKFNKKIITQKDTLKFECIYHSDTNHRSIGTLRLLVTNANRLKQWNFRYPLMDGKSSGSFIVNDSLPSGEYLFDFKVQKEFLRIEGAIRDYWKKDKSINYMMLGKLNGSYFNIVQLTKKGTFTLPNLYFSDTAYIIFTPPTKRNLNNWYIDLKTPLDSTFSPPILVSETISVANLANSFSTINISKPPLKQNQSDFNNLRSKTTLPDVEVNGYKKSKVEMFDSEVPTGMFKGRNNVRIFDGLENDQILRSFDVKSFIFNQLPQLKIRIQKNGPPIVFDISKGEADKECDFYFDEYKLSDISELNKINTNEVAMIKYYPYPSFLVGSFTKAAVVVYTKKGKWAEEGYRLSNYKFKVAGYSSEEVDWQ